MYAVLDIETTGGLYNDEGITEIAIYRFDGKEIVDTLVSLVNPEKDIQPFVVKLTGINRKMLKNAPKFYELAKRIVEITQDCTLVAHNAQFDYRILKLEFNRLGYSYNRKTICSVELSKKLIPNLPSYSLGKLSKSLGIVVGNRHRAEGDAQATVKLFKILLQKDLENSILKSLVVQDTKPSLNSRLLGLMETVPNTAGVYYFYNQKGDIIYIGKSKNMRKRVLQHFTNDSPKAKKIQSIISDLTIEETGSELVALLKENELIKRHQPIFNENTISNRFTHGVVSSKGPKGYINFKIEKDKGQDMLITFSSYKGAKNFLFKICKEYELCYSYCSLHKAKGPCFNQELGKCNGACINEEFVPDYNKKAEKVISFNSLEKKNFILIDRGRNINEKSVVLIEDGEFSGLGFFDLNYQITNIEILKNLITPMSPNRDAHHIIQSVLRKKNKIKKVII